ncbi:MAG: hypothetical protein ACRDUY_12255 [Nitriliruptorales bacterium]
MPRLLALAEGEVLATLTQLPDEWRIAVVRTLDEALTWGPSGQDVTLVDLGEVDASVRAAEKLRDATGDAPCVVVAAAGDETAGFPSIARGSVGSHLGALLGVLAHGGEEVPAVDGTPPPPVVTSVRRPPTPAPVAGVALLQRLRGRVLPNAEPAPTSVDDRIDRALVALGELTALVGDLPALRTVEDVAAALVEELDDVFAPDAAAVWLAGPDGHYAVAASRGLTGGERRLRVATSHPVFSDLLTNVDSVLVTPIDEARSLVAGLAGARGTSLMAASVGVGGDEPAIVTLAREVEYRRSHLAELERVAAEAGPGIALARGLEKLGVLGGAGQARGPADLPEDGPAPLRQGMGHG